MHLYFILCAFIVKKGLVVHFDTKPLLENGIYMIIPAKKTPVLNVQT